MCGRQPIDVSLSSLPLSPPFLSKVKRRNILQKGLTNKPKLLGEVGEGNIIVGATQIGVLGREYWFIITFYFCIWLKFSKNKVGFLVVVLSSLYFRGEGTKVTVKLNSFMNF